MAIYKNLNGDSNIVEFHIDPNSIEITFRNGEIYGYTDESVGNTFLNEMIRLALRGYGLNGFLNTTIKNKHAYKK